MKRIRINKLAMAAGLGVALALGSSASAWSQAPEKGSARGGAALLLKPAAPVGTSNYQPMSCGSCKDTFVTVRDNEVRGGGAKTLLAAAAPTKLVAKHACPTCGAEWKTVGHGKARVNVVTHKCTACGAESLACCNTKKDNASPTIGMQSN